MVDRKYIHCIKKKKLYGFCVSPTPTPLYIDCNSDNINIDVVCCFLCYSLFWFFFLSLEVISSMEYIDSICLFIFILYFIYRQEAQWYYDCYYYFQNNNMSKHTHTKSRMKPWLSLKNKYKSTTSTTMTTTKLLVRF